MPDKKIEALLKKYLDGTTTPEEEKLVDDWYNSLSDKDQVGLSDNERIFLRNVYWTAIRSSANARTAKGRDIWPKLLAVAASLAIISMIIFYAVLPDSSETATGVVTPAAKAIIENQAKVIESVTLPDGSRVRLFSNSTLKYAEDFNVAERKIYLSGQAFFEIVHDPDKPFYVFANEVVTKVLGTSFTVTAYPGDENIIVAVTAGKVSVYAPGPNRNTTRLDGGDKEIILTPNQQAVFTRTDRKVSRTLVKEPQLVIPEEEVRKVRFEGAPVSEVFEALEKMYSVEIKFEESVFSKCAITTSVYGRDMFERIDVICEIIGASYKVEGTTIVIVGTGCN